MASTVGVICARWLSCWTIWWTYCDASSLLSSVGGHGSALMSLKMFLGGDLIALISDERWSIEI